MIETHPLCPVCGYDLKLTNVAAMVTKCPSCGFDFKEANDSPLPFHDFNAANLLVRIQRRLWMEAHMPWCATDVPKPADWDPIQQMQRIGLFLDIPTFETWQSMHPVISPKNSPRFLELAVQAMTQLDWKPEVIEALWDGDTQGWFLELTVSTSARNQAIPQKRYTLFTLRGAGGDLRLFNGIVPAWPEAQVAAFVGEALSKQLDIPFYFPSPEAPNDDYAGWWERNEQKRCISCGKYLRDDPFIKDRCFLCERGQARNNTT